ncbi:hypothetical protein HOLleu_11612 [Holothuria leucospilota]|uniref:Uncharacterized protein n=1 Tax=Holothuria leucospilota TaxID=206669 RepID=A0A9Q1HGL6_HOLLE|nr:hypothetical protein HOLleu_11612 [Holothuria leucospilota]
MDAATRGLKGRRVCGGIEFIVQTGMIGIVSKTRELVKVFLVTGIICALILASSIIILGIAIISGNIYALDRVLVVVMVIVAMELIVTVFGIIFACLPLCGKSEGQGVNATQYHQNTSLPSSYTSRHYPGTEPV